MPVLPLNPFIAFATSLFSKLPSISSGMRFLPSELICFVATMCDGAMCVLCSSEVFIGWETEMDFVFIVVFRFPYGEASSIRALNICRLLRDAGNRVHVISDYSSNADGECDCCTYESVSQFSTSLLSRHNTVRRSMAALERYCESHSIDAVLINARFDRFDKITAFCRRNELKLYVENCEWYHFSSFKLGVFDPRYWKNEWMIRRDFRRADGFISISRLLDEHNSGFGIPSIRIPTIMDTTEICCDLGRTCDWDRITLAYTGSPGKSKEFLYPVIAALAEDDELGSRIVFNVYGLNRDQVILNISGNADILDKAGASVVIHGRVAQTEIGEIVRDSDYLIFLRPNRRSSNAGFPTKLGESMAVGTPVISNDTGDIGLYLKDGVNGFIVEDSGTETVKNVLRRLLTQPKDAYTAMRIAARKTAEESFEYRRYIGLVKHMLAR